MRCHLELAGPFHIIQSSRLIASWAESSLAGGVTSLHCHLENDTRGPLSELRREIRLE